MHPPPRLRYRDVTFLVIIGVVAIVGSLVTHSATRYYNSVPETGVTDARDVGVPLPAARKY
jgi:hypothetical protein